jgi:hypothetical protein
MSPDIRQHRGAHPADRKLFAAEQLPTLRTAVSELSWLLSHGYTPKASLKLVGDRHHLAERQRLGVSRAACADKSVELRTANRLEVKRIASSDLIIDGFNLIISVEAALSGGLLMLCRDGCIRDLSSVHGSYRSVTETNAAISLIGEAIEGLKPKSVEWVLDRPVSNSGRLAKRIREMAAERAWPWQVEIVFNPDTRIISADKIAITSDSSILDRAARWVNFNRYLVESRLRNCWLVNVADG